jgi:hypothetical protein
VRNPEDVALTVELGSSVGSNGAPCGGETSEGIKPRKVRTVHVVRIHETSVDWNEWRGRYAAGIGETLKESSRLQEDVLILKKIGQAARREPHG